MHAALRRAFAPLVGDDKVSVNFAVQLATQPNRFHVISWGNCPVLRTLDVERLVVGLCRFTGSYGDAPDGTVRTDLAAAVGNGGAVLVHRELREGLVKEESRLRNRGFSMLEAPWADVDMSTGELVVTDPELPVDPAGLEVLRALAARARRPDRAVPAGRYPLAGVVLGGETAGLPIARPQAAYQLVQRFTTPEGNPEMAGLLAELGTFTERVPAVQAASAEEARAQIVRLGLRLQTLTDSGARSVDG